MTKFFELKGGLGNQLFQYFAGQIIGKETSENVVFFLPNNHVHKIHHASTILDLELPQLVETDFKLSNERTSTWIRCRQWLSRNSEISRILLNRYSDTYIAGTVGFDSDLHNYRMSSHFEGYFQTYRFVASFKEQTEFHLQIKRPTMPYKIALKRIISAQPVVIHIRRGDYMSLNNSIGVLGTDYYVEAMKAMEETNPHAPVWLFTDDLVGADKVIRDLDIDFDQIVSINSGLSAAETMLLMSQGCGIIIANSTFSWWAAYLGSNSRRVIAPTPWYRTNSIEGELVPSNWELFNAVWDN
jgi:hypothetical protein